MNLAFNILIFQNEIPKAIQTIQDLIPLGPDAFIVQDLGLVQLIREIAPDQRIHASTQMTITNSEAIDLVQDLNMKRFVLGRENSLEDIKMIRAQTKKEIEVFVHGALCVSYSGQCFTSESIGGRSANRGQCAQSCRFSYELYVDGKLKDLRDKKYLVSPQDLCGLSEVEALIRIGVDCLKVEGRLKTPEYVASSARSYKKALTNTLDSESIDLAKIEMGSTYSRGFFSGWLNGVDHQELVDGTFSSHRGAYIGEILFHNKTSFLLSLTNSKIVLEPGDGVLWVNERGEEKGGFIFEVDQDSNSRVFLTFSNEVRITDEDVRARVYLNHDKSLKRDVAQSVEMKEKRKRNPVSFAVNLEIGRPIELKMQCREFETSVISTALIEPAANKGISTEQIHAELSALMGTPFELVGFEVINTPSIPFYFPMKIVKDLRRQLVDQMEKKLVFHESQNIHQVDGWVESQTHPIVNKVLKEARLHILLREKTQVDDLIDSIGQGHLQLDQIGSVILDFEFGRDYSESLEKIKQVNVSVGIATTRILKPGEYRHLNVIAKMKPDFILVRNLGALGYLKQNYTIPLVGDFSLNVSNHLTANYLLKKGLDRICLSYDLNADQISQVLSKGNGDKLEVTIFQYMPSFHMEHCVFASCLSSGSSYKDCGKPCEKHDVVLKDQFGNFHQIKPDHECRNTMYNARSQTAARYISKWVDEGLVHLRFEALKETGQELIKKIQLHQDFLNGQVSEEMILNELGALENYGLSDGTLGKKKEYQSLKKSDRMTRGLA